MSVPPTKQEVLEKYRAVISKQDFEFLISDRMPDPESVHQEGVTLQVLGTINGYWVIAKKVGLTIIGVICFMGGGLIPGLEYTWKYTKVAYDEVEKLVALGQTNCLTPATEYRLTERPQQWAIPDQENIYLVNNPPTTTTTTTPPPTTTPSPTTTPIPSGSGLVPYSPNWYGYS